jgi:hypothetical protein
MRDKDRGTYNGGQRNKGWRSEYGGQRTEEHRTEDGIMIRTEY